MAAQISRATSTSTTTPAASPTHPGLRGRLQVHVVGVGDVEVELADGRVQDPLRRPHPGPDAREWRVAEHPQRGRPVREPAALATETARDPPPPARTSTHPNDHDDADDDRDRASARLVRQAAPNPRRRIALCRGQQAAATAVTARATQAPRVPDTKTTAVVSTHRTATTPFDVASPEPSCAVAETEAMTAIAATSPGLPYVRPS